MRIGLSGFGDVRLVRAMLAGDKPRAEGWVTHEYPRVYRMLRYLTGDREAAEDLTQQAFVQAWPALPSFRGEAGLDTWLHRIAYRQYTHWLRDRHETVPLSDAAPVEDAGSAKGLTTLMVQRALRTLSEELREPFLLFYGRQLSVREVAGILEIPPGTVKSRLYTARSLLRQRLTGGPILPKAEAERAEDATVGGSQ